MLTIACVAQLYCTIASVTSASRMMFAFSRDGAVPGWQLWRKLNPRNRVPVNSVWGIVFLSWALMIPTWWNAAVGYLVGTSVAVIGLYIAFGIPIYLRLRNGNRFERGAFHLGQHYKWLDVVAIAWIILICILFLMPITPTGIPWKSGFDWNVVN
jgi:amino acid transporter